MQIKLYNDNNCNEQNKGYNNIYKALNCFFFKIAIELLDFIPFGSAFQSSAPGMRL